MPVVTLAVDLLLAIIANAQGVSQLIATANARGSDLTLAELGTIINSDSLARAQCLVAIASAKAAGK